jgi:hypothetical protein
MLAPLWSLAKFVVLLAGTASAAVWAGLALGVVESAMAIWAIFWLIRLRTDKTVRHRHVMLLLVVTAMALLYAGLIWWLLAKYPIAVAWATARLGPVQPLGVTLPLSPVAAVPFINALFLVLCVAVKMLALSPVGLERIQGSGSMESLAEWAHRHRAAGWFLKPWWLMSRVFGIALVLLGIASLVLQWWALPDSLLISWLSPLASALIPIGLEWYFWLSSEVDDQPEVEFGGRDQDPVRTEAIFEDLWRRYRHIWPGHWTAAGNRAPERRDG